MTFSEEGIKQGIAAAEKNIATFDEAIRKERDVIRELQWMQEQIDRKEDLKTKGAAIGKFIESEMMNQRKLPDDAS